MAVAFIVTSVPPVQPELWAAVPPSSGVVPQALDPLDLRALAIPPSLGSVTQAWQPSDTPPRRIILHIQDLHAHPEAQHHISRLIGHLQAQTHARLVAVEGGAGPADIAFFTRCPDRQALQRVTGLFVDHALLTGAEAYAITHPGEVTLWGVEDAPMYLEHVRVYQRGAASHAHARASLARLRRHLEARVPAVYPLFVRRLWRCAALLRRDRPPKGALQAYLQALITAARAARVDPGLVARLRPYVEALHGADLAQAIDDVHAAVERTLLTTDRQRSLRLLLEWTGFAGNLLEVKLSPNELAAYHRRRDEFTPERLWQALAQVSPRDPPITRDALIQLHAGLPNQERFYALALSRNDPLIRNTIEQLSRQAQPVGILIAGGFHTPGITEQLRANRIAYAVITPRVTHPVSDALYRDRLEGRMPDPARFAKQIRRRVGVTDALIAPSSTIEPGASQPIRYQTADGRFHRATRSAYLRLALAAAVPAALLATGAGWSEAVDGIMGGVLAFHWWIPKYAPEDHLTSSAGGGDPTSGQEALNPRAAWEMFQATCARDEVALPLDRMSWRPELERALRQLASMSVEEQQRFLEAGLGVAHPDIEVPGKPHYQDTIQAILRTIIPTLHRYEQQRNIGTRLSETDLARQDFVLLEFLILVRWAQQDRAGLEARVAAISKARDARDGSLVAPHVLILLAATFFAAWLGIDVGLLEAASHASPAQETAGWLSRPVLIGAGLALSALLGVVGWYWRWKSRPPRLAALKWLLRMNSAILAHPIPPWVLQAFPKSLESADRGVVEQALWVIQGYGAQVSSEPIMEHLAVLLQSDVHRARVLQVLEHIGPSAAVPVIMDQLAVLIRDHWIIGGELSVDLSAVLQTIKALGPLAVTEELVTLLLACLSHQHTMGIHSDAIGILRSLPSDLAQGRLFLVLLGLVIGEYFIRPPLEWQEEPVFPSTSVESLTQLEAMEPTPLRHWRRLANARTKPLRTILQKQPALYLELLRSGYADLFHDDPGALRRSEGERERQALAHAAALLQGVFPGYELVKIEAALQAWVALSRLETPARFTLDPHGVAVGFEVERWNRDKEPHEQNWPPGTRLSEAAREFKRRIALMRQADMLVPEDYYWNVHANASLADPRDGQRFLAAGGDRLLHAALSPYNHLMRTLHNLPRLYGRSLYFVHQDNMVYDPHRRDHARLEMKEPKMGKEPVIGDEATIDGLMRMLEFIRFLLPQVPYMTDEELERMIQRHTEAMEAPYREAGLPLTGRSGLAADRAALQGWIGRQREYDERRFHVQQRLEVYAEQVRAGPPQAPSSEIVGGTFAMVLGWWGLRAAGAQEVGIGGSAASGAWKWVVDLAGACAPFAWIAVPVAVVLVVAVWAIRRWGLPQWFQRGLKSAAPQPSVVIEPSPERVEPSMPLGPAPLTDEEAAQAWERLMAFLEPYNVFAHPLTRAHFLPAFRQALEQFQGLSADQRRQRLEASLGFQHEGIVVPRERVHLQPNLPALVNDLFTVLIGVESMEREEARRAIIAQLGEKLPVCLLELLILSHVPDLPSEEREQWEARIHAIHAFRLRTGRRYVRLSDLSTEWPLLTARDLDQAWNDIQGLLRQYDVATDPPLTQARFAGALAQALDVARRLPIEDQEQRLEVAWGVDHAEFHVPSDYIHYEDSVRSLIAHHQFLLETVEEERRTPAGFEEALQIFLLEFLLMARWAERNQAELDYLAPQIYHRRQALGRYLTSEECQALRRRWRSLPPAHAKRFRVKGNGAFLWRKGGPEIAVETLAKHAVERYGFKRLQVRVSDGAQPPLILRLDPRYRTLEAGRIKAAEWPSAEWRALLAHVLAQEYDEMPEEAFRRLQAFARRGTPLTLVIADAYAYLGGNHRPGDGIVVLHRHVFEPALAQWHVLVDPLTGAPTRVRTTPLECMIMAHELVHELSRQGAEVDQPAERPARDLRNFQRFVDPARQPEALAFLNGILDVPVGEQELPLSIAENLLASVQAAVDATLTDEPQRRRAWKIFQGHLGVHPLQGRLIVRFHREELIAELLEAFPRGHQAQALLNRWLTSRYGVRVILSGGGIHYKGDPQAIARIPWAAVGDLHFKPIGASRTNLIDWWHPGTMAQYADEAQQRMEPILRRAEAAVRAGGRYSEQIAVAVGEIRQTLRLDEVLDDLAANEDAPARQQASREWVDHWRRQASTVATSARFEEAMRLDPAVNLRAWVLYRLANLPQRLSGLSPLRDGGEGRDAGQLAHYGGAMEPFIRLTPERFIDHFSAWLQGHRGRPLTPEESSDIRRFAGLLAPSTRPNDPLTAGATLDDVREFMMHDLSFPNVCTRAAPYVAAVLFRQGFPRRLVNRIGSSSSHEQPMMHRYVETEVAGERLVGDIVADQFESGSPVGVVVIPVALVESSLSHNRLPWYADWLEIPQDLPRIVKRWGDHAKGLARTSATVSSSHPVFTEATAPGRPFTIPTRLPHSNESSEVAEILERTVRGLEEVRRAQ